jgi:hypothetical protein
MRNVYEISAIQSSRFCCW